MIKIKKKIISFLDNSQKKKILFLLMLMILGAVSELFGISLILLIINIFLGNNFYKNENIFNAWLFNLVEKINFENLLIFIFIFFSVKILIQLIVVWKENLFLKNLKEKISIKLFNNLINSSPNIIFTKNSSEYLRNFTEEIANVIWFYRGVLTISLELIMFMSFALLLILFQPFISFIVIMFFSIIALSYFFLVKDNLSKWSHVSLSNRKKKIQFVNETFSSIKSIKIFGIENYFINRFNIRTLSETQISFKVSMLNSVSRFILEYILIIVILSILFTLYFQNVPYLKIINILALFSLAAVRIIPIINRILISLQGLRYGVISFKKIFEQLNQPVFQNKKLNENFPFNKKINIKIKNFYYEKKKLLFKNVHFKINKFSKIGIIGESGSGKSTLIDIICGFTTNKNINVKVDEKNILTNLQSWHKKIGYIPQDIIILNQSLRENILFGLNSSKYSDKKILDVIEQVNLTNFLKKLPNKLSHIIYQDGKNISGGEKQRIAIARALLRDPDLILLDEATSGLDRITESKILDTIKRLKKTIIIVSHRLNSLKHSDKVYIIKNNAIKLYKIKF